MQILACTAKIHRATVTEADLNYVGSITIDEALLEASGIRPFQMVQITNVANGTRWRTYAIAGKRGNGDMCLNGPPARHFQKGDVIIVLAEALVDPSEFAAMSPVVVFVDEHNHVTTVQRHRAIPIRATRA
ncbi:MAG TPA: aspartate 1-decarboxylase [Candidatus Paceibacterota bacterium]